MMQVPDLRSIGGRLFVCVRRLSEADKRAPARRRGPDDLPQVAFDVIVGFAIATSPQDAGALLWSTTSIETNVSDWIEIDGSNSAAIGVSLRDGFAIAAPLASVRMPIHNPR